MVEIKNIKIGDEPYLGIHMYLPRTPLFILMSTKTILAQDMFSIDYFEDKPSVCVILTHYGFGFDTLVNGEVVACNESARQHHVCLGMKGSDALALCEKEAE